MVTGSGPKYNDVISGLEWKAYNLETVRAIWKIGDDYYTKQRSLFQNSPSLFAYDVIYLRKLRFNNSIGLGKYVTVYKSH